MIWAKRIKDAEEMGGFSIENIIGGFTEKKMMIRVDKK